MLQCPRQYLAPWLGRVRLAWLNDWVVVERHNRLLPQQTAAAECPRDVTQLPSSLPLIITGLRNLGDLATSMRIQPAGGALSPSSRASQLPALGSVSRRSSDPGTLDIPGHAHASGAAMASSLAPPLMRTSQPNLSHLDAAASARRSRLLVAPSEPLRASAPAGQWARATTWHGSSGVLAAEAWWRWLVH